jgi:predicted transposase YdaD
MPSLAQRWLEEGRAEGIQYGMQQGIQKGIFETAIVMIKDFQIAIDDVVEKLNIKKDELLEYMKTRDK